MSDTYDCGFKCKFCGRICVTEEECFDHQKSCDKFIVIPRGSSASATASATASTSASVTASCSGDNKKISCKYCAQLFTLRKNCTRHERNCEKNPSVSSLFTCEICGSTSRREDNFKTHVQKCKERVNKQKGGQAGQSQEKFYSRSKTPCLFQDCHQEFFHKGKLIEHLQSSHDGVAIQDPILKQFNSVTEFHTWKDDEQEKTFSYFSQKSGQLASKIKYFYCQHDGISHSSRKTSRLNLKGRVKVGHKCIAKMKVTKDEDGKINVVYYPTHSHICSPADFVHHPLSKKINLYINERISWGVSPTKILRDVQKREISTSSSVQQIQSCKASIISKKRIRERSRKRREKLRYHKDEATAVYLMVQQLKEKEDCVVLYKPYGSDVVVGPKEVNLLPDHKDLFMLGLQTKRQAKLMVDHCHKVVLVDETHGTNHHGYKLLTIMVIDDNRRGWPVGHLISSKSDAETLQHFFKAIKENLHGVDFNINCVISDDDSALINSMDLGFVGELGALLHILCKWHILKAFKKNLRSHVPLNMVDEMMTELRVLVNEPDKQVFSQLQAGFILKYENLPKCKSFISDYYKKYYENRVEKWAMCHRNFPHCNVNTTGHIESFHHRLKKVYLKRKVNRRLDDLITILLDIEFDDHITRVREATVGMAFQPQEILMRHTRGLALKEEDLTRVDVNTWDIKSASNRSVTYFIVKYNEACSSDHCFSKCNQIACSSLCAHMYSCSCQDTHPLCKHIHRLHSFLMRDVAKQVRDNETPDGIISMDESSTHENLEQNELSEPVVTSDNPEQRRTLTRQFQEFEDNLSRLYDFISAAKAKCDSSLVHSNAVAHAAVVTNELVLQLKYMSEDAQEIAHMEPSIKFNSNEKLKTQQSQVPSFKKPPAKKKKAAQGVSPTEKKAVVQNLLGVLNFHDRSAPSGFTPPVTFLDPTDVVLKVADENISYINLKSLESQLSDEELQICKRADAAFQTGWLYSSIINAYLETLEERYPSVLVLSSDLAMRAFRGYSNTNILRKGLDGVQKKDVLLLPANTSGDHWCILAVLLDLASPQVWFYDPLQHQLSHGMENLLFQFTADLKTLYPTSCNWDSVVYVEAKKQTDSINCGVHVCAFAEQMARKSRPYQLHPNINAFRKDIYDAIVGGCLKFTHGANQCRVCGQDYSQETLPNSIWISCRKCEHWYHKECVKHYSVDFVCPVF